MDNLKPQRRSDRTFFWLALAGTLLVAVLPYIIGWSMTPTGALFYGNKVIAPADYSIYYSYINQGRTGHLAMYDAFTSESHAATLIQPLWLVVGLLARLVHASTPAAFAAARWLSTPALFIVLWWAAGWLWPTAYRRRRLGTLLAIGASGLGGLAAVATNAGVTGKLWTFPDLWVSEAYTVLTLWSSAHFILVTSGTIFILVAVERSWQERRWSWALWAGLVALAVFSLHPFHLVTWLVLWLLLTIWRWIANRRLPWAYVARWATVLAISSPMLLLYGLQLLFDPITVGRAIQNVNYSSSPWLMVVGLGLPLLFAIIGAWIWRPRDERWRWLVALAAAYAVAVYLPLTFQRRLSQGMVLPLAWLSVPAIIGCVAAIRRRFPFGHSITLAALLIILPSSWIIVGGLIVKNYSDDLFVAPKHMYYIDPEHQQLATFLQTTDPHQPVLATLLEGNVIAGMTSHQVFVGYGVETLDFGNKFIAMSTFYSAMATEQQRQLLQRWQLCYVLDSPRSRAYGNAFQPTTWPDLRRVWSGTTMVLYQTPYCR